jgi:putative hydrolase of the HAD superfamily
MTSILPVKALFLDVGGVLLTNGWDRRMRAEAAKLFRLDYTEMNERHHLTFDTYEEGKLTLEEYLDRVIFHQQRSFSRDEFREFMFAQSRSYSEMIKLVRELKARHGLKIVVISNEGRELTVHRIQKFNLTEFVDFFVSSCFVHFRKPDADIFRMALDMAQVPQDRAVYVDDRAMFVEVAQGLGFRGIVHKSYETTRDTLAKLGLEMT